MKSISINKISALGQFFVFAGLLAILCLPLFWGIAMPQEYWIKQGIMLVIWVGLFYLNLYVLLPYLLFSRRSGLFFLTIIIIVPSVTWLSHSIDEQVGMKEAIQNHFHLPKEKINPEKEVIDHFWVTILALMLIGCSTVIGVGKRLRKEAQEKESLEKESINAELLFLKAQINPHFLFNILNSIYALAEGNSQVSDAVYNLSHLMRYVLYDTRHSMTSLHKEVAFVEDYIKLMDLRVMPNVQVIFDKPPVIRDVSVAPMLFLPFIENAYKHGISSIHPSFIYIGIRQSDDILEIEVRNSLFANQPSEKEESNGIGIVNTRRRLDLIYPGKYTLETIENSERSEFVVHLKLELS